MRTSLWFGYAMLLSCVSTVVVANQPVDVPQAKVKELMEEQIGIFETPPENFDHTVQVSACLVQVNDRILSLQRSLHKYDPGKWEVPGGKFLEGETLHICAARELFEETGIQQNHFQEIGALYVRRQEGDFTLQVIRTEFDAFPEVKISKEHQSYQWVTIDEMRSLDLIKGEDVLINMYLKSCY